MDTARSLDGASAINCYSGRQKLVHDRGGRQPARHGARDRPDAYNGDGGDTRIPGGK